MNMAPGPQSIVVKNNHDVLTLHVEFNKSYTNHKKY